MTNLRFSPLSLVTLTALALLPAMSACGEPPPAPVEVPEDFSSEPDVQTLIVAKYRAAKAAPERPETHRSLGLALAVNDGGALAEASFSTALELDPNDAESRYQRALLMGARGDLDQQIAEFRQTIRDDPTFYAGTYALGCALLDRGDLDEAEAAFQVVRAKQGATFMGHLGLGLVALERDQPAEAIELLSQAAQKYPQDQFIQFQLGQAHRALGQDAQAEAYLASIEKTAGRPILRSPGAVEAASYELSRAVQLKRANDLMKRGDFQRARPILEKQFDQDSADTAAGNNLAIAYMRLGQIEKSLAVLDRCIEIDPDQYESLGTQAGALLMLAERRRKAGDVPGSKVVVEQAFQASAKAVQLAPRIGTIQTIYGQCLSALRRDKEAVQAFEQALALGETGEATYVAMLNPVRRFQGVIGLEALLRKGIAEPGPRARLRFELCGVLLKSGRGAEARVAQRELSKVAPGSDFARQADAILRQNNH